MTQEEFNKKCSETSNEDLIKYANKELSNLCNTGGKSIHMSVPPQVTETDMVFSELIKRFDSLEQRNRELVYGIQKAIDELNTVDGRSIWDIEYDLKQLLSKNSAPAGQKGGENG